tara:strand:+ start:52 stop:468 length:417 start_codon:yes stop_codon:yes gene_type:complete
MERKIIYKKQGMSLIEHWELKPNYNPDYKTREEMLDNWVYKTKTTFIRIQEEANDLRYRGFGIQAIWWISIGMPHGNITKTLKRVDDNDFSKVEEYINKQLKKNGFNTISVKKDAEQIGASPAEYKIENIKKELSQEI